MDLRNNQMQSLVPEVPELIARFLKRRGFLNIEDQIDFLYPSIKEIKSPFVLTGMKEACERLYLARTNKEKIGVYGDYDLDGSSGVAILKEGLETLGCGEVETYQPRRLSEGYGFHTQGVDSLSEQGVSLIVTVDVGITSHETCLYAKSKGIDVILTDHHLPDETLPEVVSLINPNSGICSGDMGYLCGAGVGFYLIYGFAKHIKEIEGKAPEAFKIDTLLDFFVIGTLTDMVPLTNENRVLVRQGLLKFSHTPRPGLRALKAHAEVLGKIIDSQDIGFKIAPKLNALSRLDTDLRPVDVLLEQDREKAEVLVKEAFSINEKRIEYLEEGLNEAQSSYEGTSPEDVVFFTSPRIHPGVMGLIATRMVEFYGVPCFIGSELEKGQIVGSARLPMGSGLSLKDIMAECSSLTQYGGHAEAAGFELPARSKFDFYKELKSYFRDLENLTFSTAPRYDCEAYLSELNKEFLKWLKSMEPFGVGFEHPVFKLSDISVMGLRKLKDKHWKISIKDGKGMESEVLWFSPTLKHEVHLIFEAASYQRMAFNFYVQPQVNFFRRAESLQLLLKDVEVAF